MKHIDLSQVAPAARPRSVRYFGGKSPRGRGTGKWIAGLLPFKKGWTYCEPFAGMLGVLLQRPPQRREIINDTRGDIVNFWRVLRDQPDELAHKIISTPHCRDVFDEARALLDRDDAPALDRAWAAITVLNSGFSSSLESRNFSVAADNYPAVWTLPEIRRLYERARHLCIENQPAERLIERLGGHDRILIYADPPYPSVRRGDYYVGTSLDIDRLTSALLGAKGLVAVSGFAGEWDHLGWRRHQFHTSISVSRARHQPKRLECLWVNWPPALDPNPHQQKELSAALQRWRCNSWDAA